MEGDKVRGCWGASRHRARGRPASPLPFPPHQEGGPEGAGGARPPPGPFFCWASRCSRSSLPWVPWFLGACQSHRLSRPRLAASALIPFRGTMVSKRRTREDTWKSEELWKHLRASQPDSQNEDQKHREKKLQKEKSVYDTDTHKHERKDRGKSKERTKDRERFRSGERDRDKMRERERGKEHQREGERERYKYKLRESSMEKDNYHIPKDKDKESNREQDKKHKRHEIKQIDTQNNLKSFEGRDKEHHRRRESRHHLEEEKTRSKERERRHTEKKDNDTKKSIDKLLTYRVEEGERVHRIQKDQELDKERERRHREKKEYSVGPGKERLSKERSHKRYEKEEEDKHKSKRSKEGSSHGDREQQPAEATERGKNREKERKKHNLRNSEYKKEERIQEDTSHQRARTVSDKGKLIEKEERDTRQEEMKDTYIYNSDMGVDNFSANYEDDFEDYEDDFEDDEDKSGEERDAEENLREIPFSRTSEIEEIQRAISAENDRICTSLPKKTENVKKEPIMEKQYPSVRNSFCGIFMDFQMANQRQSSRSMASKQKKRSAELLPLIDLDFSVSFSLLDLPPVNEYDMYIRNFGKMNTKQAYVQCNEDNLERDIQTEEVETLEKWTQHPGESALVSGGPTNSQDTSVNGALTPKIDSQRLANFLQSACQVIAVLLEEDQVATQPRWKLRSRQTSLSISDSCFQLNTNQPFLHGRKISCLYVSQVQRQTLLSVHGLPEKAGDGLLNRKSIICVWNIWQPSSPQKVLICDSEVICCCLSPNKTTLVFAGTVDGSLLVWDLREDSRMHLHMMISETDWTFRVPTFSTDGVLNSVTHTSPVLAVEPVSTSLCADQNYGLSGLSYQEEVSGSPFQIASMDENGILNMWVVVELQKVDLAGSQTDLGLIPGGKVKLVHSSTMELNNSLFPKDVRQRMPQTLTIKFQSSNHFIVGTNIGLVGHGTRHDLKVLPKLFRPQESGLRSISINAIDFFPFGKPLFLVGCSDGSIRLHQMTSEYPLMQWNDSTNGQPIIALQWALTRPAVFFVLDASSNIYIWDLLENDLLPVAKQTIPAENVVTMTLLGEPEKANGLLGIALAKDCGQIDIQYVKKKWALPQPEESEKLHLLLLQSF
ncbi:PREDICTED: WD repeat-containing protein 60 [Calidris pugnax]|uniref:WD repeat-containing protein 60 n=1 Tax=Calidris pugnax TaxID=198806 RepID=UPI00071D1C72|nr:PREDICTED: WD repeat-containing protein 60 [Calidris pugnax]